MMNIEKNIVNEIVIKVNETHEIARNVKNDENIRTSSTNNDLILAGTNSIALKKRCNQNNLKCEESERIKDTLLKNCDEMNNNMYSNNNNNTSSSINITKSNNNISIGDTNINNHDINITNDNINSCNNNNNLVIYNNDVHTSSNKNELNNQKNKSGNTESVTTIATTVNNNNNNNGNNGGIYNNIEHNFNTTDNNIDDAVDSINNSFVMEDEAIISKRANRNFHVCSIFFHSTLLVLIILLMIILYYDFLQIVIYKRENVLLFLCGLLLSFLFIHISIILYISILFIKQKEASKKIRTIESKIHFIVLLYLSLCVFFYIFGDKSFIRYHTFYLTLVLATIYYFLPFFLYILLRLILCFLVLILIFTKRKTPTPKKILKKLKIIKFLEYKDYREQMLFNKNKNNSDNDWDDSLKTGIETVRGDTVTIVDIPNMVALDNINDNSSGNNTMDTASININTGCDKMKGCNNKYVEDNTNTCHFDIHDNLKNTSNVINISAKTNTNGSTNINNIKSNIQADNNNMSDKIINNTKHGDNDGNSNSNSNNNNCECKKEFDKFSDNKDITDSNESIDKNENNTKKGIFEYFKKVKKKKKKKSEKEKNDLYLTEDNNAFFINVENSNYTCSICRSKYLNDDDICILPCNYRHYYHKECIFTWLKKNNDCPLCRKIIGKA
ncbi:RING zinc finger protein, putative [Hepatocystis sp. ex Piliocolobus tephrosceles]|nr:RING zinc finger protein, putative [Hepatocystis sp. ex Piliocolobus tephrosceles]